MNQNISSSSLAIKIILYSLLSTVTGNHTILFCDLVFTCGSLKNYKFEIYLNVK